jgi:type IV secretory pathway TrbF-like protein
LLGARKKNLEVVGGSNSPKEKTVENPYLANRDASDDRYMNQAVSRQNWIRAWQITVGLLAISIGFNGYYMTQSKFIPYIVEVDKIGHIINVGVADKANTIDTKRILRATMIEWIENSRAVISDQLAMKRIVGKVYAHVTSNGKAKKQLDEYYKAKNLFELSSKQTISAEVTVALPLAGNTWQIEWTETMRNQSGDMIGTERWKAVITYDFYPLDTEEAIRANPSQIFVTDFSWSKQI